MADLVERPPDAFIVEHFGDEELHASLVAMTTRLAGVIVKGIQKYVECFRKLDPHSPHMPLAVLVDPRHRGGPFVAANKGDASKATTVLRDYDNLLIKLAVNGEWVFSC